MSDLIERLRGNVTEAALRLIAGAFRRDGEQLESNRRPRFSIPTRPAEDDDCVVIDALKEAATALSEAKAENERLREALRWKSDTDTMPKDRKILVVWKDLYSDNDPSGPVFTVGHTFWNQNHWANKPSSHWGPFSWCDFPGFEPPARAALNPKGGDNGEA